MGIIVLRIALDPAASVVLGRWRLPVARLLLLHLALDAGTNAAADGLGLSKLLDLLGGPTPTPTPNPDPSPSPDPNPNPKQV